MTPDRRKKLATVAALLAAIAVLWWTERGRPPQPQDPATQPELREPQRRQPGELPAPAPASDERAATRRGPASDQDPGSAAPPTAAAPPPAAATAVDLASISDPDERASVARVVQTIDAGGPFPYRKDGSVFENREKRLPARRPGYWREYTVPTPDEEDRGARRIVAGGQRELYYSRDHYHTFSIVRAAVAR